MNYDKFSEDELLLKIEKPENELINLKSLNRRLKKPEGTSTKTQQTYTSTLESIAGAVYISILLNSMKHLLLFIAYKNECVITLKLLEQL